MRGMGNLGQLPQWWQMWDVDYVGGKRVGINWQGWLYATFPMAAVVAAGMGKPEDVGGGHIRLTHVFDQNGKQLTAK